MIEEAVLKEIFPKGFGARRRIEVKKMNDFLQALDAGSVSEITNDQDWKERILNKKCKGIEIRDLMLQCFNDAGIECKSEAFKKLGTDRQKRVDLFFTVFDVYPHANESTLNIEQDEEEPTEEKQEPEEAPSIQVELPTREDFPKSMEEMEKYYQTAEQVIFDDAFDVSIFTMIDAMPITLQSNFFVEVLDENFKILPDCVAIADEAGIVAYGCAKQEDDRYDLTFAVENIKFDRFTDNCNFKLVLLPLQNNGKVYIKECEINYQPPQQVHNTLCIDFGTSNTTAGTYQVLNPDARGEEAIEIVKFVDATDDNHEKEMLPTIVYVKDCSGDQVEYLFGYDAKQKVIEQDYDTKASVFYEIKRWINELDKEIEIKDENGRKKKILREEVLKAYLQHIITLSERYFKAHFEKIHFSAPIKLKDVFVETMDRFFGSKYIIVSPKVSLDEGVAIIYDHIAKLREEDRQSGMEEQVFVLDCGGGTTDLARCRYHYDLSGLHQQLIIDTQFENGNFNFGGNNITYRILQLLKIKLAKQLQNTGFNLDTMIPFENNDMLASIDQAMANKRLAEEKKHIYGVLEEAYLEASKIIPTCFGNNEICNTENKRRQYKRNYYYLWQMAEAVKIQFYRLTNVVEMDFNDEDGRSVVAQNVEQYYLYVDDNGKMVKLDNPMKDIEINIKELKKLLYADLYMLLNGLLKEEDCTGENKFYQLSGQSCKIDLFHDLLKEFIPGKRLRYKKSEKLDAVRSRKLKMACINGCIEYMMDKEYSEMQPIINERGANLIYEVIRENKFGNETVLGEAGAKIITATENSMHIALAVRDENGVVQRNIKYEFVTNNPSPEKLTFDDVREWVRESTSMSDLKLEAVFEQINDIPDRENAMIIFVLPARDKYGMNIYQILLHGSEYYRYCKETFESYENLVTFFDGER